MKSELSDETLSRLAEHQNALEKLLSEVPEPRMTTVSDKDGAHLNANQSSYIRLAVDCLTAARGQPVALWRDAYWLKTGGWRFSSLQVDQDARNWGWQYKSLPSAIRYVFWSAVVMLVCVGLWTVTKSVYVWAVAASHN